MSHHVIAALMWLSLYLAFRLLVPHLKLPPVREVFFVALVVSVFTWSLLTLALIGSLSRLPVRRLADALLFAAFLALLLLSLKMKLPRVVVELALLVGSIFLGRLIAGFIREPNLILPAGLVAIMMDIWHVWGGGLGAQVMKVPEIAKKAASIAAVGVPLAGGKHFGMLDVGGMFVGDPVFLALFFTLLHRFGLNARASLHWCLGMMVLAMLLVSMVGIDLPALVFLMPGILLPNWRHFRLSRSEWGALGIGAAALLAVLTAASLLLRRLG